MYITLFQVLPEHMQTIIGRSVRPESLVRESPMILISVFAATPPPLPRVVSISIIDVVTRLFNWLWLAD